MSDILEVTGMVISSMPVGEADRRILLLTKERGKIACFARGARRPNSQIMGACMPMSFGRFYVFEGRNSYTLRNAEITTHFDEITADYDNFIYASYFLELADYYGREGIDGSQMVNLLFVTFKALLNKAIDNKLVRGIYEIRLISINGECPDFFKCVSCGNAESIKTYSYGFCGMLCEKCIEKEKGKIMSESAIYALQYIVTAFLGKLYTFTVSKQVLNEVIKVANSIRQMAIDRKIKSLELLEENIKL